MHLPESGYALTTRPRLSDAREDGFIFAVIFEGNRRPGARDDYVGPVGTLRPRLVAIEGFIERFASLGRRWPTHTLHREIHTGLGAALEPDTVPLDGDVFNSIIAPSDGLSRWGCRISPLLRLALTRPAPTDWCRSSAITACSPSPGRPITSRPDDHSK
jgi:hypothetical protein